MARRSKAHTRATVRGPECLERRELLSVLLEGRGANDLAGSALTPIGHNFLIHPTAPIEDFAIGAPLAPTAPASLAHQGEVYVIIGQPGLNTTASVGCISPNVRVTGCDLINTFLASGDAVLITGEGSEDQAGFSVAGVGDVIGPGGPDGLPDLLIGAPFHPGPTGPGAAYLVSGATIAAAFGSGAAISLSSPAVIELDGEAPGDQFGASVAGIGAGCFLVGAPMFGATDTGLVQVYCVVPGTPPTVELRSKIIGPSDGAHLGGVPVGELTSSDPAIAGFKGYSVSGVRNPALVDPGTAQFNSTLFSVYDGSAPDVLLGAPDACVHQRTQADVSPDPSDYACTPTAGVIRPGLAYLLSGVPLIDPTGPLPHVFTLSSHPDLLELRAIVVRGEKNGDRLGSAVSPAGDLDGDCGPVAGAYVDCASGRSDFMFSAPRNDLGSTNANLDAGKVYVVFGEEVITPADTPEKVDPDGVTNPLVPIDDTNKPSDPDNGRCLLTTEVDHPDATDDVLHLLSSRRTNFFRQCSNGIGTRVFPLNAGDFEGLNLHIGLTLKGEGTGDKLGTSLGDARDFVGPVSFLSTNQLRVSDILVGAPFHDVTTPDKRTLPRAGRAYAISGDTIAYATSGDSRSMVLIQEFGSLFDGHAAGDSYGISVAGVGNVFDPPGSAGDDAAIGANRADVTLGTPAATATDVGEIELIPGDSGAAGGPLGGNVLPFIQPGPPGPQFLVGGYWSFTRQAPPAGSVLVPPILPSRSRDVTFNISDPSLPFVLPPAQPITAVSGLFPPGTVGPFVAALPYGAPAFIPGTALSLGSRASKFRPPRFIYTVTSAGHLFEYRKTKRGWRLQDLTLLTGGPPISNDLRGMVVAFGKRVVREIFLTDTENHAIRYFFGRNHRWRFEDLSGVAGGASVLDGVTELGMRSR